MRFTVTINLDNDSFTDGNAPHEIGRILKHVASEVYYLTDPLVLRDVNGNKVGEAKYVRIRAKSKA